MSNPPPPSGDRASRLILDVSAFAANLAVFRAATGPEVAVGAVLKGNAYGHGFFDCLPHLHAAADILFVISVPEALAVRAWERRVGAPRRTVLVIGVVSGAEAVAAARDDVELVVGDPGFAEVSAALTTSDAPPLRVHIHIDTGLSREGLSPAELVDDLGWLAGAGAAVEVVGILTHFADTEDVTEQTWARRQLVAFDAGHAALVGLLAALGRPTTLQRHAAASAAALVLPESRLDVVRVGIGAYGIWPSRETRISTRLVSGDVPELRPVLSWRCRSQLVKTLPSGSYVGYGCTHRCRDATRIAVLPVGYWDGYPRVLSNRAHVLVGGRRCPVLGRVMMNHVIVDVTGVPGVLDGAAIDAVLLGTDGDERVTADDLAGWAGTIAYEILTRLGAHLPRVLVGVSDDPATV